MIRVPGLSLLLGAVLLAAAAMASEPTAFRLTSGSFAPGGTLADAQVFNSFGCSGGNVSPALAWSGVPEGTRSFALMVHDPDAPTGSGWWHWVVYDIPADVRSLPAGAGAIDGRQLPAGAVHGRTDFGFAGYGGACPPQGDAPHRYNFRLFALNVERLEVPADATAALIGFMVNAASLGVAEVQATYGR